MHLTLVVPGALVPATMASDIVDASQAPRLEARLTRGIAVEEAVAADSLRGAAHLAWLNPRLFGVEGDAPTAPYVYAAVTGNPPRANEQLFLAELAHLGFARDHLVVETLAPAPTEAERAALIASADAVCREHGCRLLDISGHAFLRPDETWSLVTTPLAAALGRSVATALPTGADATRWLRLQNEVQMHWHQHPVNVAREAAGLRPINAIWLHGGGAWKPLPEPRFSSLHANSIELRAAALAAGMPTAGPDAPPTDRSLIVRDDLFDAVSRNDWSHWIDSLSRLDGWLASLSSATIEFVLAGRDRVRSRRSSPWDRFVRWRALPLAEILAE